MGRLILGKSVPRTLQDKIPNKIYMLFFFLGQLSSIAFPRHEEEYLQLTVSCHPCLLIFGQNCNAKCQLLNMLLGRRLLPTTKISSEEHCKRRRIRFTHGRQTRISLALPGQYELVHNLAAHQSSWETIPEEDLEIHDDDEDLAHQIAELEVTLNHTLLQVPNENKYLCTHHFMFKQVYIRK